MQHLLRHGCRSTGVPGWGGVSRQCGAVGTPFGGTKQSGFGREHTLETLCEFTYAKTLRIPSGEAEITGVLDAL